MSDGYFHGRFYDGMYRNGGYRYGRACNPNITATWYEERRNEKMVADLRAAQRELRQH